MTTSVKLGMYPGLSALPSSIRQTAGDAFSRNMKRVFVFILGTIDCFTQELALLLKLLKLSQ